VVTGAIVGLVLGVSSRTRRFEAEAIDASRRDEAAALRAKGTLAPEVSRDSLSHLTIPLLRKGFLELSPAGFEVSVRGPGRLIGWRDVTAFSLSGRGHVEYRYTPAYISRQRGIFRRYVLSLSRGLRASKVSSAELAVLLDGWRRRWT
jgi:hypothetical protein